ncbi:MAG: energy transducer TonB [Betaproteobacteria bacterium]
MSCSWSEALRAAATPRLALALAASASLHAALLGGLEPPAAPGGSALANPIIAVLVGEAAAQEPPPKPAARPAPAANRYWRTRELDVVPGIRTRVHPEFPDLARVSGKVLIRLFIDERGTVEHVAILRAEPAGVFEASARRAFLAARFTPGMKSGVPVKSQLTLQVDYTQPR